MKHRFTAALAVLLIFAGIAFADDKPKPEAPIATTVATVGKPALTADEKLSIRNAQFKIQALQLEMKQLEERWVQLKKASDDQRQELGAAITTALAAHKLAPAEWQLDGDLTPVAVPKPKEPAKEKEKAAK